MATPRFSQRPDIPELRRSAMIRTKVTPGQLADLRTIANGWEVDVPTAVYGIVAEFIANCREEALRLGMDPQLRTLVASARILAGIDREESDEQRQVAEWEGAADTGGTRQPSEE